MKSRPSASSHIRVAINREGGLFIFFLIALAFAAVYSGKSGLMLLFSCLLAAFVIFVILARRNFSQPVSVERRFVEEIFAGRDTRIDVIVKNSGVQPVYGLHIFERFEDGSEIGPMFVRKLAPGETATARYMCQFPTRGNAHFCGFQLRSRFPMPFFELRRDICLESSVPVYPHPDPETHLIAFNEAVSDKPPLRFHRKETTIRELVHGRKTGRILWKLSARRQCWIEEARIPIRKRQGMPVIVLVDKNQIGSEKYEGQISQITSFILRQIQHDMCGELQIGHMIYPYGRSPAQRREILETLAVV